MSTKQHIYYYSYIRAAACVAVILLHTCNAAEILYRDQITLTERALSLSVVACMMWAVPCFVMVSGALLLDPDRTVTLRSIFSRYILRVIIALTACCIIFRGFDMIMDGEDITIAFVVQGLRNLLSGGSWAHLWYLYLMVGLYLILPFCRQMTQNSSKQELLYLLLVLFLFLSVIPLVQSCGVHIAFYIPVSVIYPFYLFAGYAIANDILRIGRRAALVLTLIGAVGMFVSAWICWAAGAEQLEALLGYSSVFVICMACGIFTLFHLSFRGRRAYKPGTVRKLLLSLDQNSFGVYLLHMIPVRLVLRYLRFNPFRYGGPVMFVALTVGFLVMTYAVVRLLRRIPAIRRIL